MKKKMIPLMLACVLLVGAGGTACGDGGTSTFDATKTQLYVANYDGGPGHVWLEDAAERFEEYYKDTEFESGKTGVEVQIYNTKSLNLGTMKTSKQYVYFTNLDSAYTYISQGDFLNVTDVVKEEKIPGEEKTVEDKLDEATVKALTAIDGNYYMVPMHQLFGGVTYNSHLFKEKGLYFVDDISESPVQNSADPRYGFVLNTSVKKSTGPDGLYGTDDDGLPSSIEEYKKLCDCMVALNITPFICYASSFHYTQHLLTALWANLGGVNDVEIGLQFTGTTDVVKVDSENNVVTSNGKPVVEENVTIDETNGHLITRQLSRYQALDFMQYIFNPEHCNTYMNPASYTATLSHTDAQLDFLIGEQINKPVGMLIEGSYWENESKDAGNLQYVKDKYPSYYNKMEYKFMPMPTQYAGRVEAIGTVGENGVTAQDGYKQTAITSEFYGFINNHAVKNNDAAQKVSKLFLQFLCTEESLRQSNVLTGMTRCLDYELTEEQYDGLGAYAKSIYDLRQNANVVASMSDSPIFVKNGSTFSLSTLHSLVWFTDSYTYPLNAFRDGKSLNDYFSLLCKYHDQTWWNGINK